mmetsp:Transcript_4129/g.7894  ORF Transcript_4129/g.7894 Transcript_4129/m.7894 type:complete len:574 (+) Transcript_4129:102-1823(+)
MAVAAARAAAVGALVRVEGPDPRGAKADDRAFYAMEGGRTTLTASGMMVRRRGEAMVITSATVLAPFLRINPVTNLPVDEMLADCHLHVFLESGKGYACQLEKIARSEDVAEAVQSLIKSPVKRQRGVHVGCVALLRLCLSDLDKNDLAWVPRFTRTLELASRGENVAVVSSPFGLVSPTVFQNSITTGIVSNVVSWPKGTRGSENVCLYLTDARSLPGSEGGPVFDAEGNIIGILGNHQERPDKSRLELGIVLPLLSFGQLLELDIDNDLSMEESKLDTPAKQQAASRRISKGLNLAESSLKRSGRSVVLICVNTSWGSGVIISESGHIVTCAHLFRPYTVVDKKTGRQTMPSHSPIRVFCRDQEREVRCSAKLLFCSESGIDIALIKLETGFSTYGLDVQLPTQPPKQGQPCVAIGHAIFDPSACLTATASAGIVSKVVGHPRDSSMPALLQSCASVFRGHSGGLLADEEGCMLGILTSNARHSNGSIIPTINFSIPVELIRPLLDSISLSEEDCLRVYDMYDKDDPQLLALWRLEASGFDPVQEGPKQVVQTNLPPSQFADFIKQFESKL